MAESPIGMQVFILLGPPGSGKGTQAKNLSRFFNLPHISTGDLLREQIHKKTEIGKTVDIYMQKGQLVPDEIILHMLFERISSSDCKKGYILDGFPRTLAQAEKLQVYFEQHQIEPLVFNLDLSDQIIINRLSNRLICAKCHTPYHLFSSPPKKAGICDICHANLICRSDDQPAVVRNRLKVYHHQTAPLIMYYKKLQLLHIIDCNHTEKEVFNQMLLFLNHDLKK
jgi:adenylate kinase